MGFSSDIQGRIQTNQVLTAEQVATITEAFNNSDNRHLFMTRDLASGVLSCSTDTAVDWSLTPLNSGWKEYRNNRHQSGEWGVDFAGLLESLFTLDGLENLTWEGSFTIVSESGEEFPAISRVNVRDNIVTRKVAEILFPNDGESHVYLAPNAN